MYGVLLLQLESTMEVIKADDKSVCVCAEQTTAFHFCNFAPNSRLPNVFPSKTYNIPIMLFGD